MKKRSVIIYIVMLIAMVVVILAKRNFHVDEISSFALSNNETGWIHYDVNVKYPSAYDFFVGQLTAQPGRQFDYATVWNNQAEDVHPPLYYLLLHTICSFMPNKFSVWQAAIINIIFGLMTLYFVRKIFFLFATEKQLESREYNAIINIISIIFALAPEVLDTVTFFRMYMMAMFFVTWVSYVVLSMIKTTASNDRIGKKLWIELFISSICSALTHYYCVMYLVLIEVFLFVYFLCHKHINKIIVQIVLAIGSAKVAITIFPAMLVHIFFGYRGTQVKENFVDVNGLTYWLHLKKFYNYVNIGLFGGILGFIIVLTMVLIAFNFFAKKKAEKENSGDIDSKVQNKKYFWL